MITFETTLGSGAKKRTSWKKEEVPREFRKKYPKASAMGSLTVKGLKALQTCAKREEQLCFD